MKTRKLGLALAGLAVAALAIGAAAVAGLQPADLSYTPNSEGQMTNIDVARAYAKNYYGDHSATTGSSATGGWTHPLNQDSNYAAEARSVAKQGEDWLSAHAKSCSTTTCAIVLDVDDTTLTTWNYELFSNWDFNPTTNGNFVGLTSGAFTGNMFPATPGMVDLVSDASDHYAIFFITGRGDAQHAATIANLVNDGAAGFADITTVPYSGATVPEIDAGYPMPTAGIVNAHGATVFTDGLFTKPPVTTPTTSYPAYLDKAEFCAPYIHATPNPVSCPTIQYKSGTRAYIESKGYDIVANFGDQFSDLEGGFADKTFKMPNPNYYLP
jgi:predicted secreted acid phosphatase